MQRSRNGQILVEVLIAISVLTVGFLGIITLLSRALSLNRVVSDNYTATYLAAEGIEITKNIIDANVLQDRAWNYQINEGVYELDYESTVLGNSRGADNPTLLLFDNNTKTYGYRLGSRTPFGRIIRVTPVGDGSAEIRVNSEVTWITRGGKQSKVDLEDHFYNWR